MDYDEFVARFQARAQERLAQFEKDVEKVKKETHARPGANVVEECPLSKPRTGARKGRVRGILK